MRVKFHSECERDWEANQKVGKRLTAKVDRLNKLILQLCHLLHSYIETP